MLAFLHGDDDHERVVRQITRGQVVGEMSLFTDEPRVATVVAVRDSVLVSLAKPAFNPLMATRAAVSMALARQVMRRLHAWGPCSRLGRKVADD